jgi:hypothetical protein
LSHSLIPGSLAPLCGRAYKATAYREATRRVDVQGRLGKLLMRAGLAGMIGLGAAACASGGAQGPGVKSAAGPRGGGKPAFQRADLAGKEAAAIDRLLGAPALTRREGPGEYRRYPFAECVLIVILYPDDKGRISVREIDAAAQVSGAPKPDLDRCLARGPARAN